MLFIHIHDGITTLKEKKERKVEIKGPRFPIKLHHNPRFYMLKLYY